MNQSTRTLSENLKSILAVKGVESWLCSAWDEATAKCSLDGTELILSVGGDGTILRAAQIALIGNIPVTGVNMGNLGFMTEMRADEVKEKIDEIVSGGGWIDERTMLEVSLAGQENSIHYVLNDVVLARGNVIRTVTIEVFIDEEPLTTYRADGVILSTATGSTGYSLSARGPILHPSSPEFILNPVLPHLANTYSVVLPADTVVKLVIRTLIPATLSLDGHTNLNITEGTEVRVRRSSYVTRFLRIRPRNHFYRTLEQKLRGKQYK